ncbi:hypothetical protein OPT61_g4813 [Boeremia exigua]|uniref:Uncharacterized protein n=1 Tax=Boeremia exigua TaxID=749465 RepID=A0ACC2ICQ3_9PLEO|nr:hypothetical protein OPT61_g4813 [Boeremia exigua]
MDDPTAQTRTCNSSQHEDYLNDVQRLCCPSLETARLAQKLKQLDLTDYVDAFVEEGFDAWETVLDMTASDMGALYLGHHQRKRLQEAIDHHFRDSMSCQASSASKKRKYTKRPRPDLNAPRRTTTAYIAYVKDMRLVAANTKLSFSETARLVGRQWQALPAVVRESYQIRAEISKRHYHAQLAKYVQSSEHCAYQTYLASFREKYPA